MKRARCSECGVRAGETGSRVEYSSRAGGVICGGCEFRRRHDRSVL